MVLRARKFAALHRTLGTRPVTPRKIPQPVVKGRRYGRKVYNALFLCSRNSARSTLTRRIELLLSLPLHRLDALAIKREITDIGLADQ